jgi:hypothetical protein
MNWQEILIFGLTVWILILSVALWWTFNYFRRLSKGIDGGNLFKTLDRLLVNQEEVAKSLVEAKQQILKFDAEGQLHIQKVGVVRFNPFKEMGGDHSFSVALLDGKDSGFVVTGLHTRERTRVYLKDIKKGNSDLELSSEEKKALNLAQKS